MSDALPKDEDDLTPEKRAEVEREYAEHRQFIDEHVEGGWIWDEKAHTLTHPDDPEVHYWVNPHTYKQLLSPKLVEQARAAMIEQIEADRSDPSVNCQ